MGELYLWTGLPDSGRFTAAVEQTIESAQIGSCTWWMVNTRRHADRIENALLNAKPNGVSGISVILAGQLAQHILADIGTTQNAVSPSVRELVFRALMGDSEYRDRWNPPDSAGWARKASQLYERMHGAVDNPVSGETLDVRIPWMRELFRRYDAWLVGQNHVDEALLPGIAGGVIRDSGARLPDRLILDRLPEPSVSITDLLTVVSENVTHTTVIADYSAGVNATSASEWVNQWVKGRDPISIQTFPSPAVTTAFAKAVFTSFDHNPNPNDTRIWFHPSETDEITHVLRDAAVRVHDQDLDESDLAIVCTDFGTTFPRLHELAPHYGLRLDASRAWPMSARPLTALVLDLLILRTQGFERSRLMSLLLNPLVRYDGRLGDETNVLLLDTTARDAGIRGGRGTFEREWRRPLERAIEHISVPRSIPDDPEAEDRVNQAAQWSSKRLRSLVGELDDVVSLISELPNPCTGKAVQDWVDKCLTELRVFPRTHTKSGLFDEFDERLTYGRLKVLFENLHQVKGVGGEKRTLATWTDLIQQGLQRLSVSEPRRIRAGIPVLSPADLPGLQVRALYVIGLTDQAWPPPPEIDLVQPFVASSKAQLAQARALMLNALLCADHVRLSCPCPQSGEHKATPAPLLLDLVTAEVGEVDDWFANDNNRDEFISALELLPVLSDQLTTSNIEAREVGIKRYAAASAQPGPTVWSMVYHGIRTEHIRQDPMSLTRFEGQLFDTEVGDAVAERFGGAQVSPTRLDTYAQCPMRFFHKYVLGVDRLRDLEDEVDPLTLGSLVHDILSDTVLKLRELRGSKRIDIGEDPDQTARVMCEVAEAHLEKIGNPSVYWDLLVHDLLGGLLDDRSPGRLKFLLNKELTDAKRSALKGEIITHVEASFGMPPEGGGDPLFAEPLRIERDGEVVEFRGRIDRIGLHPDKGWRVWDYKTGEKTPASLETMKQGLKFQLPVYLWALQKAVEDGVVTDISDIDLAGFIMLTKEKTTLGGKLDVKNFSEFSEALQDRVFELQNSVRAGRFHHPLSQDDKLCSDGKYNNCPYRSACRRDHFLFRQRETMLDRDALEHAYLFDFQPTLLDRREGVV